MTSNPTGVPVVLLHHLKHNKVLHETVVIMSIEGEEFPQVAAEERVDAGGPGRRVLQGGGSLRLHGDPGCAGAARLGRAARAFAPGPARPASTWAGRRCCRRPGQARRLAQAAVHRHGAERPVRHRLLQSAAQPGARAGRTDSGVRVRAHSYPRRRFCSKISRSATQAVALRCWVPSVSDHTDIDLVPLAPDSPFSRAQPQRSLRRGVDSLDKSTPGVIRGRKTRGLTCWW